MTDAQNTVKVTVIDEHNVGKGSYLQWTERGNDMSGEKYYWDTKQNGHVDIACQ
jgi:hypothetical protein